MTADADKNPNKLLDVIGSDASIYTRRSRAGTNMDAQGGQAKYETDQSVESRQFVFGLRGTSPDLQGCGAAGKPCESMNFLGVFPGLQRVNLSVVVQDSRGSLPFDTKSERVVKVGLQFQVF